jgi:hypothetical protein
MSLVARMRTMGLGTEGGQEDEDPNEDKGVKINRRTRGG